jgi:RimJ/RimL family protein N-acetyltransferase
VFLTEASFDYQAKRLVVREPLDEELEALLAVYTSNSDYLDLTEGPGDQAYDLEKLRRDLAIARITPRRRLEGIFLAETGEPIGVLDWMEENPSDGKPWVGVLIVRADYQRRGIASEAFEGLAETMRLRGFAAVRAGVIARNRAGPRSHGGWDSAPSRRS